jgi:hypothetical protein
MCDYLATTKQHLQQHVRPVHEKLKEYQCVFCHLLFSQRGDTRQTRSNCARENSSFFLSTLPKIVHSSQQFVSSRKIKTTSASIDERWWRWFLLVQQQQSTTTDNSTNSSTTSTTTTVAKRFQYTAKQSLRVHIEAVHLEIRHRCPNCKSTFSQKINLAQHRRLTCARKPVQCDRCRKRFPERDWLVGA